MKQTFTILGLIIGLALNAQNWSPILTGEKMNYKHSDSAYITNTVWVDSAQIVDSDSLFFLNRIVKDVPNNQEIALRNQPQFLLKSIVKQAYGIYTCAGPYNYSILSLADLGQTWDFTDNINAEITSISEEDIFGQTDSVKTISLSDGNEIRLSKSFGIMKFPDFENGGYFELVGIQDTDYGESIPGFWDIYNFEVGDIFQQYQETGYIGDWWHITRKITITSKTVSDSSYSYTVDGIYYSFANYGPPESYSYTDNLLFIDSVNHPANKFPGQIYQFPYSAMANSDTIFSVTKVMLDSETNLVHKHFGNQEENYIPFETNLYYEEDEGSDTLFRFEYASVIGDPCGLMGFGYGESIGDLYRTEGCFEYWELKSLMGYIKDGDTVGTITPDSILLSVGIKDIVINNNTFNIYPNPCKNIVNFRTIGNPFAFPFKLELRNMQGLLVKEILISKKEGQVDVSELPQGVYFYTIKSEKEIIQSGKLVIQ